MRIWCVRPVSRRTRHRVAPRQAPQRLHVRDGVLALRRCWRVEPRMPSPRSATSRDSMRIAPTAPSATARYAAGGRVALEHGVQPAFGERASWRSRAGRRCPCRCGERCRAAWRSRACRGAARRRAPGPSPCRSPCARTERWRCRTACRSTTMWPSSNAMRKPAGRLVRPRRRHVHGDALARRARGAPDPARARRRRTPCPSCTGCARRSQLLSGKLAPQGRGQRRARVRGADHERI